MSQESDPAAIRGTLQLPAQELKLASHEAVGPERARLRFTAIGLGLALVGAGVNAIEGASATSWVTYALLLGSMLLSLQGTRTERARKLRVTRERLAQTEAGDVRYALDATGLTINRHSTSISLAWRECHGYEEGKHTFALYFDRQLPELVLKRAFLPDDVEAVRALLARCVRDGAVGRRALRRATVLSIAMGVVILALGVGVALLARR